MIEAKINKIGSLAYRAKVKSRIRQKTCQAHIVGFDTEYTSKKNNLICFQLSVGMKSGDSVLVEVKPGEVLTPQWLYDEACMLIGSHPEHIIFATYYSAAELQFLPVLQEGFNIMEYQSGGFMDCDFCVENNAVCTFFDLARWFPHQPLSKAAESFGYEKMEFNTKHVVRKYLRSPDFQDYAIHDARLCYMIMQDLRRAFMTETGVDPVIVKTPACASADAFRNLYVSNDLYCDNNHARKLAMRGAWGGRAEVFKRGKFSGYEEWDLKSAYPSSIIEIGEMPIQESWKEIKNVKNLEKYKGGFAKVYFTFPEKTFAPCLPVFDKDCLLYPLEGLSFCTLYEMQIALELGARLELVEGFGYRRGTTALKDYCQMTLEKRKESSGALNHTYKLLGNGLIGKTAQGLSKIRLDEYIRIAEENDYLLDELFSLSKEYLLALGAESYTSVGSVFMPEWFGLATGLTRAELAYMLNQNIDPIYCHTDSVWCKKKPRTRWLKIDKKIEGDVTAIRTRFAMIGQAKTLKDIKADKAHIAHHSIWNQLAALQMLNKFDGQDFTRKYPKRRPLRLHEAVRQGKEPGQWVEEYRTGSTKWDNKRLLKPDGTTCPFQDVEEHQKAVKMAKK